MLMLSSWSGIYLGEIILLKRMPCFIFEVCVIIEGGFFEVVPLFDNIFLNEDKITTLGLIFKGPILLLISLIILSLC